MVQAEALRNPVHVERQWFDVIITAYVFRAIVVSGILTVNSSERVCPEVDVWVSLWCAPANSKSSTVQNGNGHRHT